MRQHSKAPHTAPHCRKTGRRSIAPLNLECLEERALLCNTISGHVYHDLNNNGRLDAGEPPLANTALELRNANSVVVARATTNAQGFYLFDRDLTISTSPQTLTRTATIPSTVTDWDLSRTIEKFNSALGDLTAVEVGYSGSITSHIRAESLDTAARRITATIAGTLTLRGPALTPMVSNLQTQRFFDAAPFDGTIDFRGPSGIDFGPQSAPGSRSQRLSEATALAQYSGTGNVTFNAVADGNSRVDGSGNVVSQINTTAEAQVTVTYTYTPASCLRPGNYTILQRQPDGYLDGRESRNGEVLANSVGTDAIPVTMTNQDLPNNDFGELRPSSLHGCVYVDLNNNGIKEPTEAVIPAVMIRLTGTDDLGTVGARFTNTGSDGCYRFDTLRPGTYQLDENHPTNFLDGKDTIGSLGGTTINDRHSNIPLPQGMDGVNYNFGELLPTGIGGCVYWDANDNGVKENGEQPLSGVKITLTGTDDLGRAVSQTQNTDAEGCYVFTPLRPGRYRLVETQPPGFISGKNSLGTAGGKIGDDEFFDIDLPAGNPARRYDFAELKRLVPPDQGGPGYERTFSHTRLVVPGPQDVNLLSKIQFLSSAGQSSLDANTMAHVIYIEGLYRTLLHRSADLAGLRHWVGLLLGGTSRTQVVQAIWHTPEHHGTQVETLYATILRRPADAFGRQLFVGAMMNGLSEMDVARIFLNSAEFSAAQADNSAFVRALYVRLLGRGADSAGLQAWTSALNTGFNRVQMVEAFINSREAYGRIVDSVYENYLYRSPDGGGREWWLGVLQRGQLSPQAFTIAVLASDETFDKARRAARG